MRVLIGCEFSGIVRDAFISLGHDAISCDLLPTERPGPHLKCDIRDVYFHDFDLAIFHPPCTHLCSSGARWWKNKQKNQEEALKFIQMLMNVPVPMIAIENPVGLISTRIRKPDQIIQPWMFGDPYVKTTCLWLKGLPCLNSTNIVEGCEQKCWKEPQSPNRWKKRSITYQGIADAMASQWG